MADTPQADTHPQVDTPWTDTPLQANTPPRQTPPCSLHAGIHTPMPSPCWDRHGYCCGRYASYWNAFLFPEFSSVLMIFPDFSTLFKIP